MEEQEINILTQITQLIMANLNDYIYQNLEKVKETIPNNSNIYIISKNYICKIIFKYDLTKNFQLFYNKGEITQLDFKKNIIQLLNSDNLFGIIPLGIDEKEYLASQNTEIILSEINFLETNNIFPKVYRLNSTNNIIY